MPDAEMRPAEEPGAIIPHAGVLVCHERHKGGEGRSFGGDCTGKPIKQPYAAVGKSHGSEQLGKRLSKQSCELYEDERK